MKRPLIALMLAALVITGLQAQEAAPPPPPAPKIWSGNVSIGGEYQYGNTTRRSATVSAETIRKTDINVFTTRLLANYASDELGLTARNTFLGNKYDHNFSKDFYWYIAEDLLADEFKDLLLRSTSGAGVAYKFWDEKDLHLALEIGLAYVSNDYDISEDTQETTGRLAVKYRQTLNAAVTLSNDLVYLPSFEESGEYLLRNELTLTSALGAGWSLKLAHIFEHNSNPPIGVRDTDVTEILALQFAF